MIRYGMMFVLMAALTGFSVYAEDEKKANPKVTEFFEKLDTDKSGNISKEEFSKFFTERLSRLPKGGDKIGNFSDRIFERLDADKDGKLTKEEFEKFSGSFGGLGEGKFDKEKIKEMIQKLKDRKKDN